MTTHGKYRAWLRASLHSAAFAGLILIAACWIVAAFVSSVEREKAMEGALKQSDGLVRLFEQNTVDILDHYDRTLLLLRKSFEDDPAHFDLRGWAARAALVSDETPQLTLIGPDGFQLASTTQDVGPPPYFGDREQFLKQIDPALDKPFISQPTMGRKTGRMGLKFSRRLRQPDGSFGGVISMTIDQNIIGRFYRTVDLGEKGSIVIRNLDGVILAAQGVVGGAVGKTVKQQAFLDALARSPSGHYWGGGAVDGINRLVAYRTSEKFPLTFAVGLAESDVLSGYQRHRTAYFLTAAIMTLLVLLAIVLTIRHQAELGRTQQNLRRLNDEISTQNIRFDAALTNMSNGLSMFDADGKLLVWNDRYVEMYGMSPGFVRPGSTINAIVEHRKHTGELDFDVGLYVQQFRQTLMEAGKSTSSSQLKDGRVISVVNTAIAGGGWVGIHEDITERKHAEAEIAHMARHDALTGLANRAEFNARLKEATDRIPQHGGAVTVLMLDLDKFKAVNDTLGHLAGDQLLVEVGRRLRSTLRETDLLARLGGDEFAIIQGGGADQHKGASALALRIINTIAQPFDLNGHPANVEVSIGIALAPEHDVEPEQLLTAADLALYDTKANGRNDFRLFQAEMLEVARTRKLAERDLRDAIARDEFELHYQPVVDVKRHMVCGVEALVRWRHPTKGLIAPDQFIPLAESTGLIVRLGNWILRQACADAVTLPAGIKVAINISAVQFSRGNLFDVILSTLVETGLSPERLELEITETSHLEGQEAHLATIRKLKSIGVSLVLDDFGTGYSSINYLTTFPFDKIKIDKSFTQGALDRRDCRAVIASTLALSQGLGIVTTAEGVETEEQFEYMRNAGVDFVQGYLFGRPAPISEFGRHPASALDALRRAADQEDVSAAKRDDSRIRA
jgi:diguanylate cyclase (GGDEF)-like protein/PAS domain S-box-containing protein